MEKSKQIVDRRGLLLGRKIFHRDQGEEFLKAAGRFCPCKSKKQQEAHANATKHQKPFCDVVDVGLSNERLI